MNFKMHFLFILLFYAVSFSSDLKELPNFYLNDLEGNTHSSSEFKNKITIIDFWGTWCLTCRDAIPLLNEIRKQYSNEKFVIVGVNIDTDNQKK